jgi:acyl-coenzyme A synthetase/AMP-(fatty) acid ligase
VKAIIVVKEGENSDKLSGTADDVKAGRQEMIAQLRDHCKQHLKRELRPMDWDFFPASKPLPKTSSGKIDKKQLTPQLAETVAAGS